MVFKEHPMRLSQKIILIICFAFAVAFFSTSLLLGFFPEDDDDIVRITFEKDDKQVLVNDYIKYHF